MSQKPPKDELDLSLYPPPQVVPSRQQKHSYDRVKRLRLKRGDILVVSDPLDAYNLSRMKWPYISFQVPIVVVQGSIEAMPAATLRKILAESEECSRLIIPK